MAHDNRLRAAASLVPPGSRVADVGSDHGLLPALLLGEGRAVCCIATERSAAAAAVLRGKATARGLGSRLVVRQGAGLAALGPEDALDVVTLTGLGGRTIARILDDPRRRALGARRFVLQPQSETARLRRSCHALGLALVDERIVLQGRRYYEVLAVEPADSPRAPEHPRLDAAALWEAGPWLVTRREPLLAALWRQRAAHARALHERLPAGPARTAAASRLDLARRVLAELGWYADPRCEDDVTFESGDAASARVWPSSRC